MMIGILLGPPGSGKGTQARKIWKKFGLPQLSTGDALRKEIAAQTDLGRKAKEFMDQGNLVPDDLMLELIKKKVASPEFKTGFILDGFPRTVHQAKCLDQMLANQKKTVEHVFLLDISEACLVERLMKRLTCPSCGSVFSGTEPAIIQCPQCGSTLVHRPDDREDVIQHRFSVYKQLTEPLVDFYKEQGTLKIIEAGTEAEGSTSSFSEDQVFEKISHYFNKELLEPLDQESRHSHENSQFFAKTGVRKFP